MAEAVPGPQPSTDVEVLPAPLGAAAASGLPFETLFMASPLAASVSRVRDGRLLAVNEAWLALTGLRRADAVGRTTVELGHWPSVDERMRYVGRLPDAEAVQYLCLRDGVKHRVRLHTTVLDLAPEPLALVYLTEATREFEAEQARAQSDQALRQANLGLQQQVELHAAIEKLARVGHWTNAEDEQDVLWSLGLYEIAGLAPKDVIQRSAGRAGIHPDDMPAWQAARAAMDGREVEFRWLRPDGQQRWFRTRIAQTMVAGNPQTDFGVVQDITAEREASTRLAEQFKLLQNIATQVPGMMYQSRLQPDGVSVISYVNDVVRTMLELEPADLERDASVLFQRVHPDDRAGVVAALAASSRQLTPLRETYRVCLPRAGMRWHHVEAVPRREADGAIVWHGFSTDVTEARLATQQLERQHRMLEAVRQAQAVFIEAEDKRKAFDGLLQAFLAVTGSSYGFVGEVLYDEDGAPYLRTNAITNIAWDEASRHMYESQRDAGMAFRSLKTLFGHAMATGEMVIANDPLHDPRAGACPRAIRAWTPFWAFRWRSEAVWWPWWAWPTTRWLQPERHRLPAAAAGRGAPARDGLARAQRAPAHPAATGGHQRTADREKLDLQATLDSIGQGLSRVDAQGHMTAYNRQLLEMLDLPEALLQGQPTLDQVLRFQTERGDFGPGFAWVDPLARAHLVQAHMGRYPKNTGARRWMAGRWKCAPARCPMAAWCAPTPTSPATWRRRKPCAKSASAWPGCWRPRAPASGKPTWPSTPSR